MLRQWAKNHNLLESLAPLYTRSRILCSLRNAFKTWIGRKRKETWILWRDAILEGKRMEAIDRAWSNAEKRLRRFTELSRETNFKPIVLILPIEHQFQRHYSEAQFQNKIKKLTEKLSLPTIDPFNALQARYSDFPSLFIPYDGRPNDKAHSIIAGEVFEFLAE